MLPFQQQTVGVDGVFLTLCSYTDIDQEIVIFMVSICCFPSDRQRYQRQTCIIKTLIWVFYGFRGRGDKNATSQCLNEMFPKFI